MRTQPLAEHEPLTFRGATLDEAIEAAEAELGPRVRVLAANHIRRGGIGGFFASDLGVEITVAVEKETAEEALGRIVEETASQERERWRERITGADVADGADVAAESTDRAASTERTASTPSFADTMHWVDPTSPAPVNSSPAVVARPPTSHPPTSHPSTSHPTARAEAIVPPHAVSQPVLSQPVLPQLAPVGRPQLPGDGRATARTTPTDAVERMTRLEAAFAALREQVGAGQDPRWQQSHAGPRGAAAPTRRQVEPAVAAAEQLIDSVVARRDGTERLSVRVVMRAAHGSEVEVHAQWSAAEEVAS